MIKYFFAAAIVVASSFFIIKFGALEAAALFIMVGIVPGTGYVVPSSVMLVVTISLMWLMMILMFNDLKPHGQPVTPRKTAKKTPIKARKAPTTAKTARKKPKPAAPRPRSYRSA